MDAERDLSPADHTAMPRRPLKLGLFLPLAETMRDGATASWADLAAMARLAEEAGFDSLWFADHLLPEGTLGHWECWSMLAAVAATTRRVTLGPLVGCTGYRNPALLAKIADTADEISGGRLVLGLGAGWHAPEYRAFGYPFDHRVSRFAEALTIIHGLLREGRIDFAGRYYQARECELRPRGPQGRRLPLMIGATGERMLGLTARYADLWNGQGGLATGEWEERQAALDAACAAVGRDPATLERTAIMQVDLPGAGPRLAGMGPARVSGSPEELARVFRGYAARGVAHLQVWLAPNSPAGVEAFAPVLQLLDQRA